MSIHDLRRAYEALPERVRRTAGPIVRRLPMRARYGSAFASTCRRLSAGLDAEAIGQEQLDSLNRLLHHANRTPFWHEVLRESGFAIPARDVRDLRMLPFLEKDVLDRQGDQMVDPGVPESCRKWVTTGGTTGTPIGLWIDRDASAIDWAYVVSAWGRVGFRLDERRVVMRGVVLRDASGVRTTTHYEPLRRELYISVFDMTENALPEMRARIGRFGARFIHGYPSAMEVLGRSYRQAGESPPRLQALLAVSENLYPGQRELLEDLFGCRVFSFYGMSEKVVFAAECEHGRGLHVEPLYGIVELVDESGRVIEKPGVRGEIVATGLISSTQPLIRYRTGDYAAWSEGPCRCGRAQRRLDRVEGRWLQEYLVAADGGRISMTSLNVHSPVFDTTRRFRFTQDHPGRAVLIVEPGTGYDEAASRRILAEIGAKLTGRVEIELRVVEEIALTGRGKHRFIDQRTPDAA